MAFISTYVDKNYVSGNLIQINGNVIDCLAGYEVEWYDISKDATRNANGTMRLQYLGQKYKIVLQSRIMFQAELQDMYSKIPMQELTVEFWNPFTGSFKTIQAYRGDRKSQLHWDISGIGKLYEPVSQSLIEL